MLARRTAVIAALSVWIGFVTLYGAVVVPLGGKVLGSAAAQGFVTQAVAVRLNIVGAVALAVLAYDAWRARLWWTWLAMAAAQVALFALHPYLSALLDAGAITDREAFYTRHRIYLWVTMAQWAAAVAHLVLTLRAWRRADAQSSR